MGLHAAAPAATERPPLAFGWAGTAATQRGPACDALGQARLPSGRRAELAPPRTGGMQQRTRCSSSVPRAGSGLRGAARSLHAFVAA